jgi:hypothetical protein
MMKGISSVEEGSNENDMGALIYSGNKTLI